MNAHNRRIINSTDAAPISRKRESKTPTERRSDDMEYSTSVLYKVFPLIRIGEMMCSTFLCIMGVVTPCCNVRWSPRGACLPILLGFVEVISQKYPLAYRDQRNGRSDFLPRVEQDGFEIKVGYSSLKGRIDRLNEEDGCLLRLRLNQRPALRIHDA